MVSRVGSAIAVAMAGLMTLAIDRVQSSQESDQAPKVINTEDESLMVLVAAGEFEMGDDNGLKNERPNRKVFVESFYIDKLEVTNGQYKRFLRWVEEHTDKSVRHPDQPAKKSHVPRYWKEFRPPLLKQTGMAELQHFDEESFRHPDHPVVGIDWFDAFAYAKWAGKRLPSEAEWEKAARGLDGRIWPWGNEWDFKKCNSGGYEWKGERDGYIYTAPSRSFPSGASPYGCQNMAGNVWEWTNDGYSSNQSRDGTAVRDADTKRKIVKGGGSNSYPSSVRPAARRGYEPEYRTFCLGFRCVKDVEAKRKEEK